MAVLFSFLVMVLVGVIFWERRVSARLEIELEAAYRARYEARKAHLDERQKLISVLFPDGDLPS